VTSPELVFVLGRGLVLVENPIHHNRPLEYEGIHPCLSLLQEASFRMLGLLLIHLMTHQRLEVD
jgi:hypothetical protein